MTNFKGYGENVVIDFTKFTDNANVLVIGSNHDSSGADSNLTGKSAIFAAIYYLLSNKTTDGVFLDDLIRRGEKFMHVDGEFDNDGEIVTIVRERERHGKETHSVFDFWIDGKKPYQEKGKNAKVLLKQFVKYLGGGDPQKYFTDFLNTTYLSAEAISKFTSKTTGSEERLALIARFLYLGIYDKASDRAKDKKNDCLKQLEKDTSTLTFLKEKLEQTILNIPVDAEKVLLKSDQELKDVKESLIKLNAKADKYREDKDHFNSLQILFTKKNSVAQSIIEIEKNIKDFIKTEQTKLTEIKENIEVLKKIDQDIYNLDEPKVIKKIERLKKEIESFKTDKLSFIGNRNSIESNFNALMKMKNKNSWDCPKCKTSLMFKDDILQIKNEDDLTNSINDLNKAQAENSIQIEQLMVKEQDYQLNLNEQMDTFNEINKLKQAKIKLEAMSDETKIKESIALLKEKSVHQTKEKGKEIANIDIEITDVKKKTGDTSEDDITENIRKVWIKINKEKEFEETLTKTVTKLEYDIQNLKTVTEDIDKIEKPLEDIQKNVEQYASLQKIFKKIRRCKIEDFLPTFEDEINTFLDMFEVGFIVKLDTLIEKKSYKSEEDKYKQQFNITVIDDLGMEAPFETFSAGGKERIAICVGFALRSLTLNKGYSNFNFLLMDEIVDRIDSVGKELFFQMLHKIDGLKMNITQNNDLKSRFKNSIHAIRENGVSYIK